MEILLDVWLSSDVYFLAGLVCTFCVGLGPRRDRKPVAGAADIVCSLTSYGLRIALSGRTCAASFRPLG
jgi:hypothetical protein